MKKSLFIIAATALVVSCSSNDVKNDVNGDLVSIGFKTTMMEKSTRATVGTNAGEMTTVLTNGEYTGTLNTDGNAIEVWAWKTVNTTNSVVFDNQPVIYNANAYADATETTHWTYTPVKYWDRTASYKFYAVAPDGVFTLTEDRDDESNRKFSLTVPNDRVIQTLQDQNGASMVKLAGAQGNGTASDAIDYLVAAVVPCAAGANTQGNADDKDVAFTFSHILSKLTVKVLTTADFDGNDKPVIKLTQLDVKLDSMATSYSQATAGTVTADAGNSGDIWATPVVRNQTITCFSVDQTNNPKYVDSLTLSTTKQQVASYLVAPTPNGATPAKCSVTVTAKYTVFYTDGIKDNCTTPETKVATLTSFVQNTSNVLNITVSPQAILFDVQTVNGFEDDVDYDVDVH